jgi:DNA repair exonuclease SbcCD nuclease subunit
MSKVAIYTDSHYSARKSSKIFHDYFELFYKNVFFPYLEEHSIDTVIHLGDVFDVRKHIDFVSLDWTKRVVMNPLKKYKVHMLVGNHDCALRNTNRINSPDLLLNEYENITVYSNPTEVKIDNLNVLFVPWINQENEKETLDLVKSTKAKVAMGHLELNGFLAHKGHIMTEARDPIDFHKFKKVFSGHYHSRSDNGTIFYIGNPYEIYFNDINEDRGFIIFDTETLEHEYVNNPYKLHHQIYYDDGVKDVDYESYQGKLVKIIVKSRKDQVKFNSVLESFYNVNVAELKIVENFIEDEEIEEYSEEMFESEDTLSILQKYVEDSELDLDKSKIQNLMFSVYKQAFELI